MVALLVLLVLLVLVTLVVLVVLHGYTSYTGCTGCTCSIYGCSGLPHPTLGIRRSHGSRSTVALKVVIIMPHLLLPKSHHTSKAKCIT